MAAARKIFDFPVPEGFPTASRPIEDGRRFRESEIVLGNAKEEDLPEIARLMCISFPEKWWEPHEPAAQRPEPAIRYKRIAQRLMPWLVEDRGYLIVAKDTANDRVVGAAGWQAPQFDGGWPTSWQEMGDEKVSPHWMPGMFRKDVVPVMGYDKKLGWTQADIDEMWASTNVESWQSEFINMYDKHRSRLMGDTPHWYLAPLFVDQDYRGRGVGSLLLDWAIAQADLHEPSTPLYLESLPNARGVYMSKGFEPVEEEGVPEYILIRRGKPRFT